MKRVVVADAGPLIALAKIEQIQLLESIFEHVHVPAIVLQETSGDLRRSGAREVDDFVSRFATVHDTQHSEFIERLCIEIDAGEAQAIAIAQKLKCAVLMDDLLGRGVAKRFGLPVIGVLGVLLQAKREKHISHVRECVEKLIDVRYRLAQPLIDEVLRIAKE
jgi:predicted nucleic acid-binding protein